jgi:hypothetical protein
VHVISIDDAFVRHDVVVVGSEGRNAAAWPSTAQALSPVDPKVKFAVQEFPLPVPPNRRLLASTSAQAANTTRGSNSKVRSMTNVACGAEWLLI